MVHHLIYMSVTYGVMISPCSYDLDADTPHATLAVYTVFFAFLTLIEQ
jgi:hypothetical protein